MLGHFVTTSVIAHAGADIGARYHCAAVGCPNVTTLENGLMWCDYPHQDAEPTRFVFCGVRCYMRSLDVNALPQG